MKTAALKDVAPAGASRLPFYPDDEVWQLNLDQVESETGRIKKKITGRHSEAGSSTQAFDTENVLYSKLRPYLNKVVCPDEPGVATTELVPLRPIPSLLDRQYLTRYLRSPQFVGWVSNEVAGAKMPRVSMKVFWSHQIPLPALAEQKRIAAILDAADELRTKRRESFTLLDDLLQSTFLDFFGDPVTNPKGWDVGCIGDLVASVNYGTSKKADVNQGKFPILRMGNISYEGGWDFSKLKYIDLEEKDLSKHLVERGQILFNRTNSRELVGKTAVFRESVPMAFAGYLVRAITGPNADPEYIGGFMNLPQTKQTLQGMCKSIVGMANINAKEFQKIRIPMPPVELQREFAGLVDQTLVHKVERETQLAELDTLFASLQYRAFRGEL